MSPSTRLRLFYFAYYGCVGTFLPYFAPYLRGLGFSGEQIGTVQMIGPLVAVPTAIAWATAADRLRAPARVLAVATAWAFLAVIFLPAARTPVAVGLVLLAYSLADRAVVPLVDSLTVEWTIHHPGSSYARIRLFGLVGFAVVTSAVGLVLTWRGDRPGDPLVPVAVAACVGGYALLALRLPVPPVPPHPPRFREMAGLLRDGPLLALLAVFSLHWGGNGSLPPPLRPLRARPRASRQRHRGGHGAGGGGRGRGAARLPPHRRALPAPLHPGRLLRGERAALAAPLPGRLGRVGGRAPAPPRLHLRTLLGRRHGRHVAGRPVAAAGHRPGHLRRRGLRRWETPWATSSPAWATTAGTASGPSSPGRRAWRSWRSSRSSPCPGLVAHRRSRSVFAPDSLAEDQEELRRGHRVDERVVGLVVGEPAGPGAPRTG